METSLVQDRLGLTCILSDTITFRDNDKFKEILAAVAGCRDKPFILYVAKVPYLDAFGIGLMIQLRDEARKHGVRFSIVNACREVRDILGKEHLPLDRAPQIPVVAPTFDGGRRDLVITSHPRGVSLAGRFCMRDQAEFLPVIHQISARSPGSFHIDLSELHFMDSIGLSMIFAANDEARRRNVSLILEKPSPVVSKLLHMTAVNKIMQVNA